MTRTRILALAAISLFFTVVGCGGQGDNAGISGPVVRVADKERLRVMADDIWPGIQETTGYTAASGLTGGLRMVTFLDFMDPGDVAFRLAANVMQVPAESSAEQIQALIAKVMREGLVMRDWHATRDGTDSLSLGGHPTDFERYAVVAVDQEGGIRDVSMLLLTREVGDQRAILMITAGENSWQRPATMERLNEFLEALPSV